MTVEDEQVVLSSGPGGVRQDGESKKKSQWKPQRQDRSAAGEARDSSWTPTQATSASLLGLLVEDNQELKSVTQTKTATHCVI